MEERSGDNVDDAAMRWSSEILLQPDWLEECGFAEQLPDLCYMTEDGQGDILGAASSPGLSLFGSEAVRNPSSGSKNDAEMTKTCEFRALSTGMVLCHSKVGGEVENGVEGKKAEQQVISSQTRK